FAREKMKHVEAVAMQTATIRTGRPPSRHSAKIPRRRTTGPWTTSLWRGEEAAPEAGRPRAGGDEASDEPPAAPADRGAGHQQGAAPRGGRRRSPRRGHAYVLIPSSLI